MCDQRLVQQRVESCTFGALVVRHTANSGLIIDRQRWNF